MRHVVDPMLIEECLVNNPRCIGHNLVDPSTMTNGLASFCMIHHRLGFVVKAQFVRTHPNKEMY